MRIYWHVEGYHSKLQIKVKKSYSKLQKDQSKFDGTFMDILAHLSINNYGNLPAKLMVVSLGLEHPTRSR